MPGESSCCMICGKPVVPGFKVCKEHLQEEKPDWDDPREMAMEAAMMAVPSEKDEAAREKAWGESGRIYKESADWS